jgi:hypothetical protein
MTVDGKVLGLLDAIAESYHGGAPSADRDLLAIKLADAMRGKTVAENAAEHRRRQRTSLKLIRGGKED